MAAAGHHVELFGMVRGPAAVPPIVPSVEQVTLIDVSPRSLRGRIYMAADAIVPSVLRLLPALGVGGLLVLAAVSLPTFFLVGASLAIVGLLVDRHKLRQWISQVLIKFRNDRAARWRGRAYAEAAHLMAERISPEAYDCLLYTSDAADE